MLNRGFLVLVEVSVPGRELPLSSGTGWGARASWQPAGFVEDEDLADAMVRLLRERSPNLSARVVSLNDLAAEVGYEEAERILDRLRNLTTAETARSRELERAAAERPRPVERRSGVERRRGHERRHAVGARPASGVLASVERRESADRRSGADRREVRSGSAHARHQRWPRLPQ